MAPVFEAVRHPDFGPAYPLATSRDREGIPQEGASVRFGWDETGLHVFAELEDSCIIANNRQDEQLHYEHGDVFDDMADGIVDTWNDEAREVAEVACKFARAHLCLDAIEQSVLDVLNG